MSLQALAKPRRQARNPARARKAKPTKLILHGTDPRTGQVEKALRSLEVDCRKTAVHPTIEPETLGVLIVTPLPGKRSAARTVEAIRKDPNGRSLPIFIVVDDDTSDATVRRLYSAGATAAFHWPREAPLFPRLVAELLGVAMVRGRASGRRSALTRRVTAHLRLLPWFTSEVKVAAQNDGEVHLYGSVAAYWQKRELEQLLARIPGVTRIASAQLSVKPGPRSDSQIARSVRSLLRSASDVDHETIRVAVQSGALTLEGVVADRRSLKRMIELVSNVAGVRDLRNNLIVVSGGGQQRDGVTARRLNGALAKWFPGERVHVAVFAGVAVIIGRARDLSRKHELEQFVGQDPGIKRVINKLDVRR